jgi:glycosyltransferase involved in cell wall biosynthesis
MNAAANCLYISYFGLEEPLVQTQVLPYVRRLAAAGNAMTLLTFEPKARRLAPEAVAKWRERLAADGIEWHSLRYHSRLSLFSKLFDIAAGGIYATRLARRKHFEIVHGRSHVAAAMGALVKRWTGARLIFDIRGLLAEEYVDAGRWRPGGLLYRLTKGAERKLLRYADGFVVLTARARDLLFPDEAARPPVEVIPCCVDMQRFATDPRDAASALRTRLGIGDRRCIVYVGGLETWYLPEETAELMTAALRSRGLMPLILTKGSADRLVRRFEQLGVAPEEYRITSAAPAEIPAYLSLSAVAISFILPAYSKLASSPTKVAEYLAAGVPVISNAGIGDLDQDLGGNDVGVLLSDFTPAGYESALATIDGLRADPSLPARCKAAARRLYDLDGVATPKYVRLYERLLGRPA